MANYFMRGSAVVQAGAERSREETVFVDQMYRLYIHNKANTIQFSGYTPEDFNLSLSSPWSSPFAALSLSDSGNATAQSIGSTAKFAGYSTMHKLATARVWDAPQYLTLELPIFLDAYHDTTDEVMRPMLELLSMAAPDEIGGLLIPPGPKPVKEVLNAATEMTGLGTGEEFDSNEAFTVRLGTWFAMEPAVITNVSANGDAAYEDETGNLISADFMITVESYFAVTRKDLLKWLLPLSRGGKK